MIDEQVQVHWHEHAVPRQERENLNGHRGCVIWFTGLSACGKSTVANLLDHKLHSMGLRSFVLDGDNIRHGLNAGPGMLKDKHGEEFSKRFGLGFSAQDREENIRRIGTVAKLFAEAGIIAITAFISPYRADRDRVRTSLGDGDFIEIFVDAPWKSAKNVIPRGFTRRPGQANSRVLPASTIRTRRRFRPELVLDAGNKSAETLADEVIGYLRSSGKIS